MWLAEEPNYLTSGAVQFDFLVVFTLEIDLLLFPWARQRKRINPSSGLRPMLFRSMQCLLSLLFVSFAPDIIHQLSCKPGQDASLTICVLMGGIIMYACSAPFLLECACFAARRTVPSIAPLLLLAANAGTAEGCGPST
jgi:hypothetical protein